MAEAKGQTDSCRGYFDVDGSGAMTELIFLLELSGPMAAFESDLIDGFNNMIARLREERTDLLVWLCEEAGKCINMNTRVPITEDSALIEQGCFTRLNPLVEVRLFMMDIPKWEGCFTRLSTFVEEHRRAHPEENIHQDNVRGSGCLFGCGGSIHLVQQEYRRTRPEDRPMRTMFIIVTDNTKIEPESGDYWTPERLRALVQQQEDEGWAFILLGANIDAEQVAGDIGIPVGNAATFACDAAGVRTNFEALGAMISSFAKGAGIPPTWSEPITEHLDKSKSSRN